MKRPSASHVLYLLVALSLLVAQYPFATSAARTFGSPLPTPGTFDSPLPTPTTPAPSVTPAVTVPAGTATPTPEPGPTATPSATPTATPVVPARPLRS
jgi:hypothetical protein